MSSRHCDPCTACCEGWLRSKKMNLAPGSACQHCVNNGCGIYETRPQSPCRNFECAWLKDEETLPDEMRPDICGAIVMLDRRWKGMKVISAVPTGPTIPAGTLEWLKAFAMKKQIPLVFTENTIVDGEFDKSMKTGFGPPSFVRAVKNSLGDDDVVKF